MLTLYLTLACGGAPPATDSESLSDTEAPTGSSSNTESSGDEVTDTELATETEEPEVEDCQDGSDNDEDGLLDCEDGDCWSHEACWTSATLQLSAEALTQGRHRTERIDRTTWVTIPDPGSWEDYGWTHTQVTSSVHQSQAFHNRHESTAFTGRLVWAHPGGTSSCTFTALRSADIGGYRYQSTTISWWMPSGTLSFDSTAGQSYWDLSSMAIDDGCPGWVEDRVLPRGSSWRWSRPFTGTIEQATVLTSMSTERSSSWARSSWGPWRTYQRRYQSQIHHTTTSSTRSLVPFTSTWSP